LLITVLGVVASGIGVYTFVEQKVAASRPPAPMSGHLNIAVAQFATFDGEGHPVALASTRGLADSVFRGLEPQFAPLREAGFDVQTRAPRVTGKVDGQSPERRAQQLEALADNAHADIVIAAKLVVGGRSVVAPELYLSSRKLLGAYELSGYHQLSPVSINGEPDSNPAAARDLRDGLVQRARGIARFIVGLGFADEHRFAQADREFKAAMPDWNDKAERRLVYLFLGNVAGKKGQLSLAQRYYRNALATDPTYGRAQLGLAEVALQRARGDCGHRGVRPNGLRATIGRYQAALRLPHEPGADIAPKVALGLGRTYLCMSQAGIATQWVDAQVQFANVVETYRRGNQHIYDLTAEAYAGLGYTAYLPARDQADAEGEFRRAAEAFEHAIEMSVDPARQAIFLGALANIHERLGAPARACDAYRRAASLDPNPAHIASYRRSQRHIPDCS
jgi:tetratricopeptide (TPR) repeat protein